MVRITPFDGTSSSLSLNITLSLSKFLREKRELFERKLFWKTKESFLPFIVNFKIKYSNFREKYKIPQFYFRQIIYGNIVTNKNTSNIQASLLRTLSNCLTSSYLNADKYRLASILEIPSARSSYRYHWCRSTHAGNTLPNVAAVDLESEILGGHHVNPHWKRVRPN